MFDASGPKQRDLQFRLFLTSDLSELPKARALIQKIGETAQLSDARIFDLQVAVSEAIANGIEHASSEVELDAWILPDRLTFEIANDGEFQPGLCKDDERRRRGLGLPLMVSLADQVHVSRLSSGKTVVSLTFFLEDYRHQMSGSETGEGVETSRSLRESETDTKLLGTHADITGRKRAKEARHKHDGSLGGVLSVMGRLRLFERQKAWQVFLPGAALQVALFLGLSNLGSPSRYLGIPGAATALIGVITAITGGPFTGVAVSLVGGAAYFAFLTNFGNSVAWPAIVVSILLWALAAAVAGLAGDWVRQVAAQREAMLEGMLTERESLTDSLCLANTGLQKINDELAKQEEELRSQTDELQAQGEELAAQNEEIRVANEELAVLYEHEREDARLREALAQVDQTLVSSLERAEILDRALENGARALGAERAVLEMREPEGWEVHSVYRLPVDLVGNVLSTQEASIATAMEESSGVLVIQDVAGDPRVNASTVARYGTTAALALPISYQDRTMGSLQFLYASGPHRFSDGEIDFAQKLAVSLALALENARLFEQQRSIAGALQQTILEMPSGIPHMLFSHLYRSATEETVVGGDFYDAFELEDGSIALLIGDVSGHGVNAARIATMVKSSLVAFAHSYSDPDDVLTLVNRLLLRKAVPGFTSLLFAVFQPETGMLTYCSAGHPELLLVRSGEVQGLVVPRATPLGVFSDWSCVSEGFQLEPGDTLLFYTDGLTEARRDGELFGEERLVKALRSKGAAPLEQLPQALLNEALAFTGGRLQDDVAILAVRPLISVPQSAASSLTLI